MSKPAEWIERMNDGNTFGKRQAAFTQNLTWIIRCLRHAELY